jgi:hypothetical protein
VFISDDRWWKILKIKKILGQRTPEKVRFRRFKNYSEGDQKT